MLIVLLSIREQTGLDLYESTMNKSQRVCVDDEYLTFSQHSWTVKMMYCEGNSLQPSVGASNTSCNKSKVKKK